MTTNDIEQLLLRCNLPQNQCAVLTALLVWGERSASALSKLTAIKRTTVYALLGDLEEQGLVTSFKRGARTIFSSISSDLLPKLLEARAQAQYREISQSSQLLKGALKQAQEGKESSVVSHSVRQFDVSSSAFLEHFRFSIAGGFTAIFNPNIAINKHTKAAVQEFLRKTGKEKFAFRELAVPGSRTSQYLDWIDNPHHEVRLLPEGFQLKSNIIMRDRTITITHYENEDLSTIQIRHPEFFKSMHSMFELLWNCSSSAEQLQ